MGLLVYKGGPVSNPTSYTLYTTANGLPSNNVTGIESYDLKTTWVTTAAGIVKMEESFLPNPNGWRFSNSRTNMWPMSLWAAYDYNFDPYLGGTAPFPLNGGNVIASSSFPDWPLFVDLLGEDQCYFVSGGVKYVRTLARNKYFAMIGNWGGSCQGFVETSFMVWDSIDYFRNKYPAVGPWTSDRLYDLPINDENRKVINKLMISQNQTPYYAFSNSRINVTPNQTLADLKVMLKSDTKNLKGLNLYNQHGKGAHIVNPYKVTKDPVEPDLEYIYVYDNNFPNDTTRKVWINTAQNAWYYNLSVNSGVASREWGGPDCHKGLNLDTTVRYWYQPIALGNIGKKQPMKLLPATGTIEVYNSDSCDISIANSSGQNIGCVGGTIMNTIPNALALRYFSLDELSPKGYFLPDNQYDAEMRSFSKQSVRFTVFNATTSYEYTRSGTSLDQKDRIHIGAGGIQVKNPDNAPKSINLSCTFEDAGSEMRVEIRNIGSQTNVITEIQRFNNSEVKLFNTTIYDINFL